MPEPGLTVGAVARRLGVAPATLRAWERRYGLGPRERESGAHRRYTPADVAVLTTMRRLTLEGVAPADAARCALDPTFEATPLPDLEFRAPRRVAARARGLSRAAFALDCVAVRGLLADAVGADGVVATWEGLLVPVLRAVGDRWAATGEGVEVEHLLAEAAGTVFRTLAAAPPEPARPVLLAAADGETHTLPLHALAAALAERRVAARMLGAGLPATALAAAVRRTGPAALVVYAHTAAPPGCLDGLPALRPPTHVLAGGAGWARVPDGVTYVHDLGDAVHLVLVAAGLA
jgi:DNA-binding transcriptional MerR regulator